MKFQLIAFIILIVCTTQVQAQKYPDDFYMSIEKLEFNSIRVKKVKRVRKYDSEKSQQLIKFDEFGRIELWENGYNDPYQEITYYYTDSGELRKVGIIEEEINRMTNEYYSNGGLLDSVYVFDSAFVVAQRKYAQHDLQGNISDLKIYEKDSLVQHFEYENTYKDSLLVSIKRKLNGKENGSLSWEFLKKGGEVITTKKCDNSWSVDSVSECYTYEIGKKGEVKTYEHHRNDTLIEFVKNKFNGKTQIKTAVHYSFNSAGKKVEEFKYTFKYRGGKKTIRTKTIDGEWKEDEEYFYFNDEENRGYSPFEYNFEDIQWRY